MCLVYHFVEPDHVKKRSVLTYLDKKHRLISCPGEEIITILVGLGKQRIAYTLLHDTHASANLIDEHFSFRSTLRIIKP